MRCRILLAVFAVVASAQFARADSPSVTAALSNSETMVGQTVDLQIKVTGPGDAQPPEEISINGLEIHATGQSRQFEMRNFATSPRRGPSTKDAGVGVECCGLSQPAYYDAPEPWRAEPGRCRARSRLC